MWCLFLMTQCNKNCLFCQLLLCSKNREWVIKQLQNVVGEIEPYYKYIHPSNHTIYSKQQEIFHAKNKGAYERVIMKNNLCDKCCIYKDCKFILVELDNFVNVLEYKKELLNNI